MTALDRSLLQRWIAARVRLMLRNPRVTFFTFAFPLMFLLIFGGLNGNAQVPAAGHAGGRVATVAINSTSSAMSSAAIAGRRSKFSSAQRYSMLRFRPSS